MHRIREKSSKYPTGELCIGSRRDTINRPSGNICSRIQQLIL